MNIFKKGYNWTKDKAKKAEKEAEKAKDKVVGETKKDYKKAESGVKQGIKAAKDPIHEVEKLWGEVKHLNDRLDWWADRHLNDFFKDVHDLKLSTILS